MPRRPMPVFFHPEQLLFKPLYEWAYGDKIDHPETTARAESILASLAAEPALFDVRPPEAIDADVLLAQHDRALLTLYDSARALPEGETFYPMVFPRESRYKADPGNLHHAGAFCFDSGTPLDGRTYSAATWSAACAHAAALEVRDGRAELAYALSRPPGHHATRSEFGGYCYFNNAGVAAAALLGRGHGRVAVVDVDFHHGNGTQSLFYADDRVLTISIHGDPSLYFPWFAGFPDETGEGRGAGFNLNLPLPGGADVQAWLDQLDRHVVPTIRRFAPDALVVSAGLDAYHLDPVGKHTLQTDDFAAIGARLGRLGLPTVAVQEGGYYTPHLGRNARALLAGLSDGVAAARVDHPKPSR